MPFARNSVRNIFVMLCPHIENNFWLVPGQPSDKNQGSFYPQLPSAPTGIVVGNCVHPSVCPAVCPSVHPSVHPEWHSCFNSLRISAISLKFGGMMHSTVEQIANWNGHARPILACSMELLNFPWWAYLTRSEGWRYRSDSWKISAISLKFDGMMHSNMKQIPIYNWPCSAKFVRST